MTTAMRTILGNILPRRSANRLAAETSPELAASAGIPAVQSIVGEGIEITADDPLFAYCLSAPGVIELDRLKLQSPALETLRVQGMRLLLPLVSQGELVGTISLGARLSEQEYSGDDFGLLHTLARQAETTLRVAQLARMQQIEARHRERMEQELKVAGVIQQTLLPRKTPDLVGWQIAASRWTAGIHCCRCDRQGRPRRVGDGVHTQYFAGGSGAPLFAGRRAGTRQQCAGRRHSAEYVRDLLVRGARYNDRKTAIRQRRS